MSDVALGIADVGCSLFWMTAERLEMSSFTANLMTDSFYLFVPMPKADTSLFSKMKTLFMPFAPEVWLVVGLVILATGALQVILTSRLWWKDWAEKVAWDEGTRFKRACLLLSRVSEGWYSAYMSVVTGGPEVDDEHRVATRLLNVGNGLFILLFISAYTANLAAFLIRKDLAGYWANIEAATESGAKICVHTMLKPKLTLHYPDTDFHFRYMDMADDIREGLAVDGCDAFIMEIRAIRTGSSIDQLRCDLGYVLTGTAVAELDVALPASPEVAHYFSYMMKTRASQNGTTYTSIQAQYQMEPICPLYPEVGGEGELKPMSLSNFAAPLITIAVFMGALPTRIHTAYWTRCTHPYALHTQWHVHCLSIAFRLLSTALIFTAIAIAIRVLRKTSLIAPAFARTSKALVNGPRRLSHVQRVLRSPSNVECGRQTHSRVQPSERKDLPVPRAQTTDACDIPDGSEQHIKVLSSLSESVQAISAQLQLLQASALFTAAEKTAEKHAD